MERLLRSPNRSRSLADALFKLSLHPNRTFRPHSAPPARAALTLPLVAESSEAFLHRLGKALSDRRTRIYIDTSFLMWMTTIGAPARQELIAWLSTLCGNRLRVPVWAAHEYYRHHTEGTLVNDLRRQLDSLEVAVATTYAQIWPLLDEPLGRAASARTQQTDVRDALRAVAGVTALARSWFDEYGRHARDVIGFINAHALEDSDVPGYFETLEAVADARFTGRVPPGFKDRRKKERNGREPDDSETLVGSNRWGDLVFWREIVDDARRRRAHAVVVLTRDGKNDWRMAGDLPSTAEDGGLAKGTQPTHPYLTFEAALNAGVGEVLILDHLRLAALASKIAESRTESFRFVASSPTLPSPKTLAERREEEIQREAAARESARLAVASSMGVRFLDPENLRATPATLGRALLGSRSDREIPAEVVAFEQALTQAGGNLDNLLTEAAAARLGCSGLTAVARRMSERADDAGTNAALIVDLAADLPRLPLNTAASLYFGLLVGAYLEPERNEPRPAPRSVILQQLFAFQPLQFAREPISALVQRLKKAERTPLYLPDPTAPRLVVEMHAHGDREPPTLLRSIIIKGLTLLTPAQGDPEMQLAVRFRGQTVTPQALLEHLAEVYGLPLAQLDIDADVDVAYDLEPVLGFRGPRHVWLDPTEIRS
ncbi:hypothetical protein KXR53_10495 [Inquilinus limosus]|uniref:PIN-like domain-containing protein n=1 Tax=Inquilinus limosus TaxID=171674 RepID=UPI003F16712E